MNEFGHQNGALSAGERESLQKLHKSWPLCFLPSRVRPYAELIRISKPAGTAMFFFPYFYGTFLLGALDPRVNTLMLLNANIQLGLLAFLMRGALCTWNDMLDQDLDRQVTRTRIRPLARRAISTNAATVFLIVQIVVIFTYLRILPNTCLLYSIPSFGLHILYPMTKRVTHHPQLILGLAFSAAIPMSFPMLDQTMTQYLKHDPYMSGFIGLSMFIVFWTLLFDTIYAAQDLEDDKKVGIGSTMVYWEAQAKNLIRVLAALVILSLLTVLFAIRRASTAGVIIYGLLTCGGTTATLLQMTETLDLANRASCGWWFGTGSIWVGLLAGCGLIGAHLA